MTYNIAAGLAFLKAGNLKSALQQAEGVLGENPRDSRGLNLKCDVLFARKNISELEKTAVDWIGYEPASLGAHLALLNVYIVRKDAKLAKELVQHFKQANPYGPDDVEILQSMYDAVFGDRAKGLARLAEMSSAQGNHKAESRMKSYLASDKGNLFEALVQGELALQRGDDDGSIAAYLSMIAFRGFRFSRSRRYARLALTKNPSLPIPRELLVLSWLVYFPPFLLGHIVMNALQWAGRWKVFSFFITLVAFYVLGLPALLLSHMLVSWTGLGFLQTALLTLGFGFYLLFIGSLAKLLRGSKPKEVVLRDY